MSIIIKNKIYTELKFEKESEFEELIFNNSEILLGKNRVLITAKKKINAGELGKSIPDGFIIDFTELSNPKIVILEIELAKHRFYDHIFPQITKFLGFLKEGNQFQVDLVDTLYRIIDNDSLLKNKISNFINSKELYKFLKDIVDNASDILIIIDGQKKEFAEIKEVYTDTWDKYVKIVKIEPYQNENDIIFHISPDLDDLNIEEADPIETINEPDQTESKRIKYSEEYHLDGVSQFVKDTYYKVKEHLRTFKVNPQKYYISFINEANFAYITLRKKKIRFTITMPKSEVDKVIQSYKTTTPSEGVQRFYNCNCTEIIVDDANGLNEVFELLTKASEYDYVRIRK